MANTLIIAVLTIMVAAGLTLFVMSLAMLIYSGYQHLRHSQVDLRMNIASGIDLPEMTIQMRPESE